MLHADRYNCGNENKVVGTNFSRDENFLIYAPTQLENKKNLIQAKDKQLVLQDDEEVFGDSCTVGSTSKSSSEWRSSINCTEDPFSSSSRRSCPKWESYTVFQKYDEEMTFLDRISAQKLQETGIYSCILSFSWEMEIDHFHLEYPNDRVTQVHSSLPKINIREDSS